MDINDLYPHLTPNDLVIIEAYFHQETPVAMVAKKLERGRQAINNVYRFLKQGKTALDYLERYQKNKKRCGRKPIEIPVEEKEYIKEKTNQGWTPDVIVGRG